MSPFELLDFEEVVPEQMAQPQAGNRGGDWYHCPGCGRFAKYAGGRHYYNGNFDCYSFDTDCKKCGIQTTECV